MAYLHHDHMAFDAPVFRLRWDRIAVLAALLAFWALVLASCLR